MKTIIGFIPFDRKYQILYTGNFSAFYYHWYKDRNRDHYKLNFTCNIYLHSDRDVAAVITIPQLFAIRYKSTNYPAKGQ